jgi:hypothetical protein
MTAVKRRREFVVAAVVIVAQGFITIIVNISRLDLTCILN